MSATVEDLRAAGFAPSEVRARRLGIVHADLPAAGPFCRLDVATAAPAAPGVYAWEVDGHVRYVGKAKALIDVVHGARMARAYNDYTYIPPSNVAQRSSPRVRVNALLNAALVAGSAVRWWWRAEQSENAAFSREAELIGSWEPDWNRARPLRPTARAATIDLGMGETD